MYRLSNSFPYLLNRVGVRMGELFSRRIAPFGVSKWTGVMRLAAEWNVRPEEICAVGDDVNDIPMIEAAGLGVDYDEALGNKFPYERAYLPVNRKLDGTMFNC